MYMHYFPAQIQQFIDIYNGRVSIRYLLLIALLSKSILIVYLFMQIFCISLALNVYWQFRLGWKLQVIGPARSGPDNVFSMLVQGWVPINHWCVHAATATSPRTTTSVRPDAQFQTKQFQHLILRIL